MTNAALTATDKFFGTVIPSSSYEIIVDESFPSSEVYWIKKMLNYTNGSFPGYQDKKVKVFLGDSIEWSKKTLQSRGLWMGNPDGKFPCSIDPINEGSCAENNLILLNFYNVEPNHNWHISRRFIPAHEYFHTIQDSLSKMDFNLAPENIRSLPRWLTEGSANYYGYYVVDRMGFNKYEESKSTNGWFNYEYGTKMPLSSYNNYTSDPYSIGHAATEYLVASAGFEKLLDIFKYSRTEKTFASAFKKAIGIELDEFYSKFELARKSM